MSSWIMKNQKKIKIKTIIKKRKAIIVFLLIKVKSKKVNVSRETYKETKTKILLILISRKTKKLDLICSIFFLQTSIFFLLTYFFRAYP